MTAIGHKRIEAFVEIDGKKVVIGHLAFPITAHLCGVNEDGTADVYSSVGRPEFEKCYVYNVNPNERTAIDEYQEQIQLDLNGGRSFPWYDI